MSEVDMQGHVLLNFLFEKFKNALMDLALTCKGGIFFLQIPAIQIRKCTFKFVTELLNKQIPRLDVFKDTFLNYILKK